LSASTVKPKQARRSNKPSSDLAGRSLNALATFSKADFRAVKIKTCEEVKKNDKLLKFVLNDGSGKNPI
jgi:tRNA-binding EMAP/Myf-like protein